MLPYTHVITALTTAVLVVICVLVHYEGLRLLSGLLPKLRRFHRRRIIIVILSLLFLHVVEVWLFGGAYYVLLHEGSFGELVGSTGPSLIDCIYFSANVYTTVGLGDLYPTGAIRTMTGTLGIVGLMMIAWSASYTYMEMVNIWGESD